MADARFSRFIRGRQRWSHGVYTEVILKCSAFISASRLSCIANAPRPHSYKVHWGRWRMHVFADFSAVVKDEAAAFTQKWSSSVQLSSLHLVFHACWWCELDLHVFDDVISILTVMIMQLSSAFAFINVQPQPASAWLLCSDTHADGKLDRRLWWWNRTLLIMQLSSSVDDGTSTFECIIMNVQLELISSLMYRLIPPFMCSLTLHHHQGEGWDFSIMNF